MDIYSGVRSYISHWDSKFCGFVGVRSSKRKGTQANQNIHVSQSNFFMLDLLIARCLAAETGELETGPV